jgi:pimeloyl-ACP methyl ester carboxylesterase
MTSQKSTNVRDIACALLRGGARWTSVLAPPLALRAAMYLFERPRRTVRAAPLWRGYADAPVFTFHAGSHRVAARSWGSGPPVLLLHGWSGHSGDLAAFVPALVQRGLRVFACDAPGHGLSPGRRTNLFEIAEVVRAVERSLGGLHGVVAHSLGCLATSLAVHDGLAVRRLVYLSAPAEIDEVAATYIAMLGFSPAVHRRMREAYERRFGTPWDELTVEHLAAAPRAAQTDLLVVHDRRDPVVPWHHARRVGKAWPGARIVTTEGLGHRSLLADPAVVRHAAGFVAGATDPAAPSRRGEGAGAASREPGAAGSRLLVSET